MRLVDVKIRPKLIGLFLLVGLLPMAIAGWYSARQAEDALMAGAFNQLSTVQAIKKSQIEKFFGERLGDKKCGPRQTSLPRQLEYKQHVGNRIQCDNYV